MEGTHQLVGIEIHHQPQKTTTYTAHQFRGMDSPAIKRSPQVPPKGRGLAKVPQEIPTMRVSTDSKQAQARQFR